MTDGKLLPFRRPSADQIESPKESAEYAERLERVKQAIEKINKLMAEIKGYEKDKGH